MEGAIREFLTRHRLFLTARITACLFLAGQPAFAAIETTPWGPFDFTPPVRTQREAQSMYDEAKAPIVVAIRFLALAETADTPWINHHLACGTNGLVRKDLALAMVRASTLMAHRLAEDLEQGRISAAELRAGRTAKRSVRYAGPVAVVLEPVRISAEGEPISPPATIEPHLRVFVSAPVPRCATDATGAYGRAGELAGGFMITASPALELGWPTYSASALGQRVVMATENLLADGFCCGQESAFGLESLVNVYEYRDYQTKNRLRNTLRTLGNAKQRGPAWVSTVRDAFGVPDRFPEPYLQGLRYGSGRIAAGDMVIWPTTTETLVVEGTPGATAAPAATVADFLLALAWYAHIRADLISPAILESYDPERKYSFVGWPEEFRAALENTGAEGEAPAPGGKVLEVFGAERKYSFVGQPDAIQDNIAFAFAAWKAEIEFVQQQVTKPFLESYAPDSALRQATRVVVQGETDAVKRRRLQTYKPLFTDTPGETAASAAYVAAIGTLNRKFELPGYFSLNGVQVPPPLRAAESYSLRWAGNAADVPAGSVEELRSGLVRLYRDTYRKQLGEPLAGKP